jgi:cell division protease FtsH
MKLNRLFRGPVAYLLLILLLVFIFFQYVSNGPEAQQPTLSEVVKAIDDGRVREFTLQDRDQKIEGEYTNGQRFVASYTQGQGQTLFNLGRDKDIKVKVENRESNVFLTILVNFLPFVLILLLFFFLMQQMQGAACFACSKRSRTRLAPTPTNISTKSDPEIE